MSNIANNIQADARNLQELLSGKKYQVDYFQREYRWQEKHIEQLLTDLETSFLANHNEGDTLESVTSYNCYFMGPIVIASKGTTRSIVDGQQRLTSMTLLLIHLHNLQRTSIDPEDLESLIYSRKHGRKSYNIEVPDRTRILDGLFQGKEVDIEQEGDESVRNMYERYQDIERIFPKSLIGDRLPLFIDWVKDKIIFVEIVAFSDENAYTIFETMNDRGLSLTSTEMLKSYILSNVKDEERIGEINDIWKKQISELHRFSPIEDLEFIKAWLRSCYAETIRSSTKGAENEDFEKIGTRFHTWVRDNLFKIGLKGAESFYYFIKADFEFYVDVYLRIKNAEVKETPSIESVYLNSFISIASSLSYPLYMSAISKLDDDKTITAKIDVIARFLDIYTVTRTLHARSTTQNSIRYFVYSLVKEVRGKDIDNLRVILKDKLQFSDDAEKRLRPYHTFSFDNKFTRYLFARMTLYLERQSENFAISIDDLMAPRRKSRFVLTDVTSLAYQTNNEMDTYFLLGNKVLIPHLLSLDFDKVDDLSKMKLLDQSSVLSASAFRKIVSHPHLPQITAFNDGEIIRRDEAIRGLISEIWSVDSL